jgi:hypothetical protein
LPEHFIYIVANKSSDSNGVGWNTVGNIQLLNTFMNCKNIKELPKHLIYIDAFPGYHNQHVAMYETFKDCGITSITEPLMYIDSNVYPYQMVGTFIGCHDLKTITSTIVEGRTYAESTSHWFSIWQDTFRGCKSLEIVTQRLDTACITYNLFDGTFADCSSLKNTSELGNYASYIATYSNSGVESVSRESLTGQVYVDTFADCVKLTTIETGDSPSYIGGSVGHGAYVTYFKDTLYRSSTINQGSLSHPIGIFKNCVSLKNTNNLVLYNGRNIFEGCTSLEKFTNIRSFYAQELSECFKGCTSLKQIDLELSVNEDGIGGNLTGLFEGCTSLEDIGGIASIPRQSDFIVKLDRTFKGCTSLAIEFPEWWEVITPENSETGYTSHIDTFEGCVNLANYNEIPDDWK